MTSLALQLQRLAVPQSQRTTSSDKNRVSLLFNPSEAANLDRETIFALGSSGLEELETIDPLFEDFEATLFNRNSTDWERSVQTKEVNEKLNTTIERYLIALSPYFLLKSAQKSLEWLIYRYHVHEYNKDKLVLCFLPYHDSKVFVRLLQVLDLKSPSDKWHWLEACANNGVSLPKSTLLNHCKRDPGFLAYICDLLPRFIEVHGADSPKLRAMVALYTGAMLGTLQVREEISEKIGFKSECLDYTAATYMILSQLASQTSIKTDFLKTLMPVITKNIKDSLTLEALSCLAVIYQTQEIGEIPKKSFNHLCLLPNIGDILINLSTRYDIRAFLQVFVQTLLRNIVRSISLDAEIMMGNVAQKKNAPDYSEIYNSLIVAVELKPVFVTEAMGQLLNRLLESMEIFSEKTDTQERDLALKLWQEHTKSVLSSTQIKYGDSIDSAIETCLSEKQESETSMATLQEITAFLLTPVKYQQIGKGQSLVLSLNHAKSATRFLAVKHLTSQIKQGELGADDFVVTSLCDRLADDSAKVVSAVLDLDETLCKILGSDKLFPLLADLIQKRVITLDKDEKWFGTVMKAVKLLDHILEEDGKMLTSAFTMLMPYFLITSATEEEHMEFVGSALYVLCKHMTDGSNMQNIFKTWMNVKDKEEDLAITDVCKLNNLVFKFVACYLQDMEWAKLESTFFSSLTSLMETSNPNGSVVYMMLCVSLELLAYTDSRDVTIRIIQKVLEIITKVQAGKSKAVVEIGDIEALKAPTEEQAGAHLAALRKKGQISADCFISLVGLVLQRLALLASKDPSGAKSDAQINQVLMNALEILMFQACTDRKRAENWQRLLKSFAATGFSMDYFLWLMCRIWLSEAVSAQLYVGSFYLLNTRLSQATDNSVHEELLNKEQPLLAVLLSALCHEQASVRKAAMTCMTSLRRVLRGSAHAALIKKVTRQEQEIEADGSQLPQTLGILFAKEGSSDANKGDDDVSKHARERRVSLDYLLNILSSENCAPTLCVRLLALLAQVPHQVVLSKVLPLGKRMLEEVKSGKATATTIEILAFIISRYDVTSAFMVTDVSDMLEFLLGAISTQNESMIPTPSQIRAIKQVDKSFFHALPTLTVQQNLVTSLIDVVVTSTCSVTSTTCMHALKHVRLQALHVQHELKPGQQAGETVKARKRTKLTDDKLLNITRARVILEAVQSKPKSAEVKANHEMTSLLFAVLKSLLSGDHEDGEYCKQLVLSALLNHCTKWTSETKPSNQESLSIELLVQCIRNSKSPLTQQQALLVMASVAHLFPEYILHHAMSIFTFMGDSLLQQDDSHTFQVITNTLNTLIPAIIKAHGEEQDSQKLHNLITDILQVFVSARHHIPKQRFHVLLRTLMETVGVCEYSWVLQVQVVESAVRAKDVPSVMQDDDVITKDMSAVDKDLNLACQMIEQFSTAEQLRACVNMLSFLQRLTPHNHDSSAQVSRRFQTPKATDKAAALHPLSVNTLTTQQLRLIEFHTARLIAELLSRDTLIVPIYQEMESGSDMYTEYFKEFTKECLALLSMVAKATGSHGNTPAAKFWRALLGKVYDILDKVNYLLPTAIFLEVVSALMGHPQLTVRKKSLELLSSKLQQLDATLFTPQEDETLLVVVERLAAILSEHVPATDLDLMNQVKQLSLFSLRLLCRMLAVRRPQHFQKLLTPLISLVTIDCAVSVLGGALLCLGELCLNLKAHALTALKPLMTSLINVISDVQLMKSSDTLLVCALTSIQKILSSMAQFLSPYLKQLLLAVCRLSTLVAADVNLDTANKNHPAVRLRNVKQHLSGDLAPRVFLPTIRDTYAQLLKAQPEAVGCLLHVLKGHVTHIAAEDLTAHNALLLNIYTRVLDVRNEIDESSSLSIAIEGDCIEALLAMVVRLSEMSFRPLYYKLYNWACGDESSQSNIRKLAFFRLSTRLSERLKSLFNLFVGHSIKTACSLLDENNSSLKTVDLYSSDERSCELLSHILAMLHSCFSHDSEGFVTMELFNALLKPLVNQLENMLGGDAMYESRISTGVIPAITQLAVATKEDATCKTLNYQICLKTRHVSPKVRFAALSCLEQLARKLGDEYMNLLPETIPFLAELMEDESEEVEQQCQQVVTSLEQLLGESLQGYF